MFLEALCTCFPKCLNSVSVVLDMVLEACMSVNKVPFLIRGLHPWLTILLLPGFWACNIVLSHEFSLGFTRC